MSENSSGNAPGRPWRLRRGVQTGYAQHHPAVTQRGLDVRQHNARTNQANRQASELIRLYRLEGLIYQAIAQQLNRMGYRTRRGKEFFATSVQRLDPAQLIRERSRADEFSTKRD